MSAASTILAELARRGVTIRAAGGRLLMAPGSALDAGILSAISQHKPEIIAAITTGTEGAAMDSSAPSVMPKGCRLVAWKPKTAPVAIDVCSVVMDVSKFIEMELTALDSRLNHPLCIHGGFTVPQILDRLSQAGVEIEVFLSPQGTQKEENKNVE